MTRQILFRRLLRDSRCLPNFTTIPDVDLRVTSQLASIAVSQDDQLHRDRLPMESNPLKFIALSNTESSLFRAFSSPTQGWATHLPSLLAGAPRTGWWSAQWLSVASARLNFVGSLCVISSSFSLVIQSRSFSAGIGARTVCALATHGRELGA